MNLGIDVKMQLGTRRAIGAVGLVFRAIGHDDGDFVIIGVNLVFHFRIFLINAKPFF